MREGNGVAGTISFPNEDWERGSVTRCYRRRMALYNLALFTRDDADGESVVPFTSDGLDFRGGDAPFGREQFVESADTLDVWIVAGGIQHVSLADHVINDDYGAQSRERKRPLEVFRYVLFIGVDKDQVERAAPLRREAGQRVQSGSQPQFDDIGQSGARDIGAGHSGVFRVGFESDQSAIGRQRAPQPDRAVTTKRADLQNGPRALNEGEQVEELALVWRHVDRRQSRRFAIVKRSIERRIRWDKQVRNITIDGSPLIGSHKLVIIMSSVPAKGLLSLSETRFAHAFRNVS
jgi:hypothetical protein